MSRNNRRRTVILMMIGFLGWAASRPLPAAHDPDPDGDFAELRYRSSAATSSRASAGPAASSSSYRYVRGFDIQGGTATSDRPWSGIWWPRKQVGLAYHAYSDGMSPLEKYDTIVYNSWGRVPGAASWESDPKHDHNHASARSKPSWTGHCNGFAAASILEREPRQPVTIRFSGSNSYKLKLKLSTPGWARWGHSEDGTSDYYRYRLGSGSITLTVADQKGWLSELYQDVLVMQFASRDQTGSRYRSSTIRTSDPSYRDIAPQYFHYLLLRHVHRGQAVIIDAATASAVFNYPLFYYKSTSTYETRTRTHFVETTCYLTDYAASAGEIGTRIKKKVYTYVLQLDAAGRITYGSWTGSSVHDHPDFVWIPVGRNPNPGTNRVNERLNYGLVKSWIRSSQSSIAD